ncbi:exopolyphosphatase PRUNE1-like [Musca vetustissima]|uniref:exopolyphosphatase PRUNE1-like n=1 Tax=Musca vetustissima TaxID=27455 RepID=UPI002AB69197|nr:exopolyphosphatase PRUNE1-like [Musca vetustissima]
MNTTAMDRQKPDTIYKYEPCCIVLGNESCDLDSAVSAVSLAYFYQQSKVIPKNCETNTNFLPILNIPRRDYPLKTEVHYLFKQYAISEDLLTFRDELSEEFLQNNKLVLVDHHVSALWKNAVAIYDHRPRDVMAKVADDCNVNLHVVGSCATLISELFIQNKFLGEDEQIALELLRSTIVLDTVNFSAEAARATPKDIEICSILEDYLKAMDNSLIARNELFNDLVRARSDVSALTPAQLLRKDLKLLANDKAGKFKIALPGFPLPVQKFIEKPNAAEDLQQFAKENACGIILLMGMFVDATDNSVHREEPNLALHLHQDSPL